MSDPKGLLRQCAQIPPGGCTVAFLKATLASAKGYICPFQKDIVIGHGSVIGGVQSQVCFLFNLNVMIHLQKFALFCATPFMPGGMGILLGLLLCKISAILSITGCLHCLWNSVGQGCQIA